MLELTLRDQIMTFAKTFLLVETRQIAEFFSDWGNEEILQEIRELIVLRKLYKHEGNRLAVSRLMPFRDRDCNNLIRSLDVMTQKFRSGDITAFRRLPYPQEMLFVVNNDALYEVTVFTSSDYLNKCNTIAKTKDIGLIDEETDPAFHIALVDTLDLAKKIKKRGDASGFSFDYYATYSSEKKNHLGKPMLEFWHF